MQTRAAEAVVVGELGVEAWTGGALGTVAEAVAESVGVLQWANRSYPNSPFASSMCSCLYCVLLKVLTQVTNKAPFFSLY